MLRFSANLTMLLGEVPFLERFARAAAAGFRQVEFAWPGDDLAGDAKDAVEAADLEVVLMNFAAGDMVAGDRGLAGDPARQEVFRSNVPVAVQLAADLGCRRLNALWRVAGIAVERQLRIAADNVAFAADAATAAGAMVLIENMNPLDNGDDILIQRADQALDLIERVDRPNVALQYDVFHAHRAGDDPIESVARLLPRIGHVQIAAPGRGEPGAG